MRPKLFAMIAFVGVAMSTPVASASMDETLDLSVHATMTTLDLPGVRTFDAPGASARVGVTLGSLRISGGPFFSTASSMRQGDGTLVDRPTLVGGEAFIGVAKPHGRVMPVLELRLHGERLLGENAAIHATYGVGPRLGLIFCLNEYFFAEVGVGRDVLGPERFRTNVALGIPIPLSHL